MKCLCMRIGEKEEIEEERGMQTGHAMTGEERMFSETENDGERSSGEESGISETGLGSPVY